MRKKLYIFLSLFTILNFFAQRPTCPKTIGVEMLPNGDFETTGGYSSAFTNCNCTSGLPADQYGIGTNPNSFNSGWFKSMGDHTSGTGKMLVIDFNENSKGDPVVQWTNVAVSAGQTYFFSAWFANVAIGNTTACPTCPSPYTVKITNSPILKFQILSAGTTTVLKEQTINVDSLTNNWNQYSTAFSSATSGAVDIKIINLRGGNGSNDLALDDISFKAGCNTIADLSALGKTSTLVKTVYTCNENFAYTLNTGLNAAKYAFDWYQGSTLQGTAGIVPTDNKSGASTPSFVVNSAPANGTKYYVCYDSLGDKLTCARLDSVIFSSSFNVDLGPNQDLCPPFTYVINPAISSNQVTYEWTKTPSATPIGTGPTLSVSTAGTYKLKTTHALAPACASPDKTVTITEKVPLFTGGITVGCSGTTATGTATLTPVTSGANSVTIIGGLAKVSWWNAITGGTRVSGITNTATGVATTPASNLVSTTSCPQGGLFLQDDNSYAATLPLVEPTGCSLQGQNGDGTGYQKIVVTAPMTITAFDIYTKSYNGSTGENITVDMLLYPNITNFNSLPAPLGVVATRNLVGFTNTTLSKVTVPGNGTLINPGTYYLKTRAYETGNTGSNKEVGYYNCKGATSNYTESSGVVTWSEWNQYNNIKTTEHGTIFNFKADVGKPTSCGRVWVCAVCTLPLDFLYFNTEVVGSELNLNWGVSKNASDFTIQESKDGINFKDIKVIPIQNNLDYNYVVSLNDYNSYFRIKQINAKGESYYSDVKFVSKNNSELIFEAVPVPVFQNSHLDIKLNNSISEHVIVEIIDLNGLLIKSLNVNTVEPELSIPMSEFKEGVYILKVQTENQIGIQKIIIE